MTSIIDYIVKYQNNYISSFMFTKNLPLILEKGIPIAHLMASKVFMFEFDYDEWPMTHYNEETVIRSYNYSIFAIR